MLGKDISRIDLKRLWIIGVLLLSAGLLRATESTSSFSEEQRTYWAFQPIAEPKPPLVRNRNWVRNPINAFILKAIESEKLKPTAEADRRSLIRRASLMASLFVLQTYNIRR